VIIKLTESTQINGSEYTELDLAIEKLKGKELIELDSGFKKYNRGEYIPVPYLDLRFQVFVAGRVTGINPEDLGELLAPDLIEVCTAVQNFLLKSGPPQTTTVRVPPSPALPS
jgi:hypothetical protein